MIGYGLTEACTVSTVNHLKNVRFDTVGKPIPKVDIELRAVDEDGVGEVWIKGPTVMSGYLDASELTEETIQQSWLYSGDIGKWDKGHLVLLGRKKNMIVTAGGKNVYAEDVGLTGLCGPRICGICQTSDLP